MASRYTRISAGSVILFLSVVSLLVTRSVVGQGTRSNRIIPVLEGPYGKDLKECKANYVEVSKDRQRFMECQKKLFFALVPRLESPEGIPELDVPSFNPLKTRDYNLGDGGMFTGSWFDSQTDGAIQLFKEENIKLTWNETEKSMLATLKADRVLSTGKYKFFINLGRLLRPDVQGTGTQGEGSVRVVGRNGVYTVKFYMRERKNGALALEKAEGHLVSIDAVQGAFEGTKPDDPFANMLTRVINDLKAEAILEVVNDFLPPFNRYLAQMAGNIVHKGWRALEQL